MSFDYRGNPPSFDQTEINAEKISTEYLEITDQYQFPEKRGDVGDLFVLQENGDLIFDKTVPNLMIEDTLTIGPYTLPVTAGANGDVLTARPGGQTAWDTAQANESKGDLMYNNTVPKQINFIGDNPQSLQPASGVGFMVIPANSVHVGDIYTLKCLGFYKVPTGQAESFRVDLRLDGLISADTGEDAISVPPANEFVLQPFEMTVIISCVSDPLDPTPNNITISGRVEYTTFGTFDNSFSTPFITLSSTIDGTTDTTVELFATMSQASIFLRVTNYSLTKQFYGFETIGQFTNQSLNTTDDVEFKSVTTSGLTVAAENTALVSVESERVEFSMVGTSVAAMGLRGQNTSVIMNSVDTAQFCFGSTTGPPYCIEHNVAKDKLIFTHDFFANRTEPLVIEPDGVKVSKLESNGQVKAPNLMGYPIVFAGNETNILSTDYFVPWGEAQNNTNQDSINERTALVLPQAGTIHGFSWIKQTGATSNVILSTGTGAGTQIENCALTNNLGWYALTAPMDVNQGDIVTLRFSGDNGTPGRSSHIIYVSPLGSESPATVPLSSNFAQEDPVASNSEELKERLQEIVDRFNELVN